MKGLLIFSNISLILSLCSITISASAWRHIHNTPATPQWWRNLWAASSTESLSRKNNRIISYWILSEISWSSSVKQFAQKLNSYSILPISWTSQLQALNQMRTYRIKPTTNNYGKELCNSRKKWAPCTTCIIRSSRNRTRSLLRRTSFFFT